MVKLSPLQGYSVTPVSGGDTVAVIGSNHKMVLFGLDQLSYAALEERANRLAHFLRGRGVGPDSLVGLCVERSQEMVIAVLGILKAGGAYVPLDPSYPASRLRYMVSDAKAELVVSASRYQGVLEELEVEAVRVDEQAEQIGEQAADNRERRGERDGAREREQHFSGEDRQPTSRQPGEEGVGLFLVLHRKRSRRHADGVVLEGAISLSAGGVSVRKAAR